MNAQTVFRGALAVALLMLAGDSIMRLRAIRAATGVQLATPVAALVRDSAEPSGFAGNQHSAIAPVKGIDGYHWVMQTQLMLRNREWRLRHVDYDGPPSGGAVHWSGLIRWWTAGVALVASMMTGDPIAESVEYVFPWANTALFAIILVTLAVVIARRFGAAPGVIFAIASVTLFQACEVFAVGNFDHHGIAATAALVTVLCLAAGGGGWVRSDEPPAKKSSAAQKELWQWLPDERRARRWFIASGVAGGVGLWLSAASQVPVFIGIGLAALAVTGVLAHHTDPEWRVAPGLWRTWGIAGACTALVFFTIEYVPTHVSMRLEVNHPLYAIALLGAGDLLARIASRARGGMSARDPALMALDARAILAVPIVAVTVEEAFALRPGSLLMAMHEEHILEFRSLVWQLGQWSWPQINAGIGMLPLLLAAPAGVLVGAQKTATPMRAMGLLTAVPATVFTLLAFRHVRWLPIAMSLWIGVSVLVTFALTTGQSVWDRSAVRRLWMGLLAASLIALLPLIILFEQRGASAALRTLAVISIALMVFASVQFASRMSERPTGRSMFLAGALIGFAFVPHPLTSVYNGLKFGTGYRAGEQDVAQLATRDIARALRARLGAERGTVLASPTTSTWLTYFGGMRSVATLYWENEPGITVASQIFSATATPAASAADNARRLMEDNGVTHVVISSWDLSGVDYTRLLARGSRTPAATDVFAQQLLAGNIPPWLTRLEYALPRLPYFEDPWVLILERNR